MNKNELIKVYKEELYTPVVGDILDTLGFVHQFLPQPIGPLLPEMKVAGFAMPVLMIDVYGPQKNLLDILQRLWISLGSMMYILHLAEKCAVHIGENCLQLQLRHEKQLVL